MVRYLLGLSVFAALGCASNGTCVKGETIINSPDERKIAAAFPQVRDRQVVYEDSYLGNFTLYYYPIKLNADSVNVLNVNCYTYMLDKPKLLHHRKCYVGLKQRYYASDANYIFDLGEGIDLAQAKAIVFAWYEHNKDEGRYI